MRQIGPAAAAGPLAERPVPQRHRPVLARAKDGRHARLSADVRRQRATARRGDAARPPRPVDRVRRGRRGAADRGATHELHAGDHVAQGGRDRSVQLVLTCLYTRV